MPEGRFAEIVILAEDRLQFRFIRYWLSKRILASKIRDFPMPGGKGSGEQHVRNNFPIELAAHRINSAKRGSMLIAVIDADTGKTSAHYRELMDQVDAETKNVFVFVPKRHIETWIHQLNGNPVDEKASYKSTYRQDPSDALRLAGDEFLVRVQTNRAADLVPSLAAGVEEARRMPREHQP